jgi:hypothetical protein
MHDALFVRGFKSLRDLTAIFPASFADIAPRFITAESVSPDTNSITIAQPPTDSTRP